MGGGGQSRCGSTGDNREGESMRLAWKPGGGYPLLLFRGQRKSSSLLSHTEHVFPLISLIALFLKWKTFS